MANFGEAREITGCDDPEVAAGKLGGALGIVTLGAAGCVLFCDGVVTRFAAPQGVAVDTTGAGDVFCGVLTAALAAGRAIEPAIIQSQAAASRAVTRAGCFAALPTAAELRDLATRPGQAPAP